LDPRFEDPLRLDFELEFLRLLLPLLELGMLFSFGGHTPRPVQQKIATPAETNVN
jgi:hypothetical protein